MIRYIVRRMLLAIPTLLAVLTVIFFIVRVAPGDPATAALGDYASAEAVAALRERMGLNEPLWKQYVTFLADLARGDLGKSLITGKPISEQIRFVLPYTLELTVAAILVGLALGVPIGVITAVRRNTAVDDAGRVLSLVGLSLPAFYLGIVLMFVFAVKLGMLPSVGAASFSQLGKHLQHLILPALALGLIETAYMARMTRSVMIGILSDDFVRTARAKGLTERTVLIRHGLRAGLIPIVSLTGIFAISLIGSSVVVEEVFARPGLGKLMVGATKQRDYTALQSIMVVYALIIVVINLLTDIVYTFVDPRVRLHA
jgi:ABC-type dipeptide/oligopeptide/nickel transport system permease component